jgi:hypothetical protein
MAAAVGAGTVAAPVLRTGKNPTGVGIVMAEGVLTTVVVIVVVVLTTL